MKALFDVLGGSFNGFTKSESEIVRVKYHHATVFKNLRSYTAPRGVAQLHLSLLLSDHDIKATNLARIHLLSQWLL